MAEALDIHEMHHADEDEGPSLYGVVAEFESPDVLLKAARKAHEAGYRSMEAYSPFPIHGLSEAVGFKKTAIPALMLAGGLSGALGGFLMECIGMAYHYPLLVGGRPFVSWPSFVPVAYECGILLAGLTGFVGMVLLNGLPRLHHPVFSAKNFERATSDRFFLCIEATDPKFDETAVHSFLKGVGAREVSEVRD